MELLPVLLAESSLADGRNKKQSLDQVVGWNEMGLFGCIGH